MSSERIVATAGQCGGNARIAGTRIPVWQLWEYREARVSDYKILEQFGDVIVQADLDAAWLYAEFNFDELDRLVKQNRAA